jgi:hypothetical protein
MFFLAVFHHTLQQTALNSKQWHRTRSGDENSNPGYGGDIYRGVYTINLKLGYIYRSILSCPVLRIPNSVAVGFGRSISVAFGAGPPYLGIISPDSRERRCEGRSGTGGERQYPIPKSEYDYGDEAVCEANDYRFQPRGGASRDEIGFQGFCLAGHRIGERSFGA